MERLSPFIGMIDHPSPDDNLGNLIIPSWISTIQCSVLFLQNSCSSSLFQGSWASRSDVEGVMKSSPVRQGGGSFAPVGAGCRLIAPYNKLGHIGLSRIYFRKTALGDARLHSVMTFIRRIGLKGCTAFFLFLYVNVLHMTRKRQVCS